MLLDDTAIKEMNCSFSVVGEARIVGHDTNRRAGTVQFVEKLHDRDSIAGIEVTCRFVREQQRRVSRKSSGDGDALLLAAR
jgi:hypothetical protein